MNTTSRIINFSYEFPFSRVEKFSYSSGNLLVRYDGYEEMEKKLDQVIKTLLSNPGSRQAVITLNRDISYMSCLLSVQWLIEEGKIHCVANFRSQHHLLGRPSDCEFLNFLTTKIQTRLIMPVARICVNVGDYHIYPA